MNIKIDDLSDGRVADLLADHRREMLEHSPPESVHALDQKGLYSTDICFWSAAIDGQLAGCGGLKKLNEKNAEIKSMRTNKAFIRRGVAAKILKVIIQEAEHRNFQRMYLETGSMEVFLPARKLYEKYGFEYCEPFADYKHDSNSVCMVKKL